MHLWGLVAALCTLLAQSNAQQKYNLGQFCSANDAVVPTPSGLNCGLESTGQPRAKWQRGAVSYTTATCAKDCYADYRCKSYFITGSSPEESSCYLQGVPTSAPDYFEPNITFTQPVTYYDRDCFSCTPTPLPKKCSKTPTLKNGDFNSAAGSLPWVVGGYPRLYWSYAHGDADDGYFLFANLPGKALGGRKTAISFAQRINGCARTRIKVSAQLAGSATRNSEPINGTAPLIVSVGNKNQTVQVRFRSNNPTAPTNFSRIFEISRDQPFLRFEMQGLPNTKVLYQWLGVQLQVLRS